MIAALLVLAATFVRPMERVSTMDPAQARSLYDSHAIALVYEAPLSVDYAARPYRLAPAFCELPRVSPDGKTYTFTVRRDTLTASDMVRALERLRDPKTPSPNGWILQDVSAIRRVDARTVELTLTRPVSYFPWLMAMPAASIVGPHGEGTGSYTLTSWWRNHEMVFTARAGQDVGFSTVRYLVVDDLSTQWLMFLKGEVDLLAEVSRDSWDALLDAQGQLSPELKQRGIKLFSAPSLEAAYLGINMRDPVLGPNKPLRQALNAAFDYPAWEAFYAHRIVRANGPVPTCAEGFSDGVFPYTYDLDKARRLLAQAGYADGVDPKTGRRLTLTLAIGRATQESREMGELLASFYARVGIRLELAFYTWDAFLKAVNEGRVQLYRMGWVGDYPHAQNFLQLFYSPNASPGVNHGNFSNRDYDAAYRREDWAACQRIAREECPWVFLHVNLSTSLVGPRVSNFIPSDFSHGNERYYRP